MDQSSIDWKVTGAQFVGELLPLVRQRALRVFRNRSPQHKDELLIRCEETAWEHWHSLITRGINPYGIGLWVLANMVVRNVYGGRPGRTPVRDAYAHLADETLIMPPVTDRTDPAVAAAHKLDTLAWLARLAHRDQIMVAAIMEGYTTGELAERFGVSPARISQLRRMLAESYRNMMNL